ncbi:MAG: hypothetical protein ACOY6K_00890 [Pseudomonadota bacterium]
MAVRADNGDAGPRAFITDGAGPPSQLRWGNKNLCLSSIAIAVTSFFADRWTKEKIVPIAHADGLCEGQHPRQTEKATIAGGPSVRSD